MEAKIAYFSAEFGIDASLPIYSGGLGVLAGDHVKAANDLGLSLVGVGIFYRKGYFEQRITAEGVQEAVYPVLNPDQLPIEPVLQADGSPLMIEVQIGARTLYLQSWMARVGSVPVYLLDADHEKNQEEDRTLTHSLYGGTQETRIAQEIILGIGGVRLLRALNIEPDVWHMNEGHSAFLTLERIRENSAKGIPFEVALEAVKAASVFTTHTPVPAGHDQFPFELVDRYLGNFYWQLGATRSQILQLGEVNHVFNMTRLAVSISSRVNAVSKLHGEVTKELIHHLWLKHIPAKHIPIESITNGIHTLTWLAPEMKAVFDMYLEHDWTMKIADRKVWERIESIPDQELWSAHQKAKKRMLTELNIPLGENTLIIGFARRFATYKRALLLFQDLSRFERLMNQTERPLCFLFAGKAHPADHPGQELIRRIKEVSQLHPFRGKVFLIENYDMNIAKHLIQGVDVWLNTPRKPMEASGTSGQKAAVNGVLNCSVLDGWWNEGYNGKNGWAITGTEGNDQKDSQELYDIFEREIVPLFYTRDEEFPAGWVAKMKESIRSLTPVFSTSCMVAEYWCKLYIPTSLRGRRFVEDDFEVARRVAAYKAFIRQHWDQVHIHSIELNTENSQEGNPSLPITTLHVVVDLGEIWHKDVVVEAVGSDGQNGLWKIELLHLHQMEGGKHLFVGHYAGNKQDWIHADANIRVVPVSPDFQHELELELSTWGEGNRINLYFE